MIYFSVAASVTILAEACSQGEGHHVALKERN